MSLFQRPIQPHAILSDEAVERYLESVRAELTVDPLFRRRLRGNVVNRFVAEREGGRTAPAARRRMGALGRAVLYASFALSVSVSTAMAASQGAVPGDPLYPLKIQIESLRLEALPDHFHDDLAAHALGERIHELGVLAERGDWARVASQAATVESEYGHFVDTARADGASENYLVVLTALLERLPERAQLAIADVIDGVEEAADGGRSDERPGNGQGPNAAGDGRGLHSTADGAETAPPNVTPSAEPTAKPTRTPRPEPTPRASGGARPSAEPEASAPSGTPDD